LVTWAILGVVIWCFDRKNVVKSAAPTVYAFSIASPTSFPFPVANPIIPSPLPTTTSAVMLMIPPPLVTLHVRLTSITRVTD
jgi:hypothetical protein